VAFSPDGRFVLTGSGDSTVRLLDSTTGREVLKFEGHSDMMAQLVSGMPRPGPLGDRGFGQLAYDKRLRIFAATQPDKVARGTAVQGPATLLIEALKTASMPTAGQGISAWLRTAERMLPQRARQLYRTLNEDDLQWPELMDFRREPAMVRTVAEAR